MNPSPIFNPSDSKENENHRIALFDLLTSRNAILFVGAGSSQRCGYPGWSGLAKQLGEIVGLLPPSAGELRKNPMLALTFIEQVKACVNIRDRCLDQYYAALQRLFAPNKLKNHDGFHEQLVSLPFRGIVTSNYDEILESALGVLNHNRRVEICDIDEDARASCSRFLRSLNDNDGARTILHVHGIHSKPTKIILSEQDYIRAYGWMHEGKKEVAGEELRKLNSWTFQSRLIWALLATRSVVFIGFSMADPYFNYLLQVVTKDLWEWNNANHFAVLGISTDDAEESKAFAKRLLNKHGISVVFYENNDGSHSSLDQLVRDAGYYCTTGDRSGWLEASNIKLEGGAAQP